MNKITMLFIGIAMSGQLQAQYNSNQNKIWAFGSSAGLTFKSGVPVPIKTGMFNNEGCATVCDTGANLLFYTNGKKVWDNTNTVMPGGTAIVPFSTASATQGALIIPDPGSSKKYYVFSIEEGENYPSNHAAPRIMYSIVDMALNSGKGDLVTGSTGILLDTVVSEKSIAIPGNDGNIWLIDHARDTSLFYAYDITATGLSHTPVVSHAGSMSGFFSYLIGVLKASHDWKKIVCTSSSTAGSKKGLELYDFDRATGVVSNCMVIDTTSSYYGAEFSPDNTKLYVHHYPAPLSNFIEQFDVTLSTPAAILASKVVLTPSGRGSSDLKLAPDGKIYMNEMDALYTPYLDCITSPNLAGLSCGYISDAITLASGSNCELGLPNVFVAVPEKIIPVPSAIAPVPKSTAGIAMYPVPAGNELNIESNDAINTLAIVNVAGQVVFSNEYNAERKVLVNVHSLASGIYHVKVNNKEGGQFLKD
ncbi:MAG: hypothetical protein JWQ38_1196 [Flavipsychrobacter sp.]|nr:hypothetical protein [Flavipsychrobacter sp.]